MRKQIEKLLTIEDVASYLRVKPSVIKYWIRTKALPYIRLGKHTRFDPADITRWLTAHKSISFCYDSNGDLKKIS